MATIGLPGVSRDFDDTTYYEAFEKAVIEPETSNFTIEFDSDSARASMNMGKETIDKMLQTNGILGSSTRWINIFAPDQQRDIVISIAKKYKFSPRLAGIMQSEQPPRSKNTSTPPTSPSKRSFDLHRSKIASLQAKLHLSDPEKNGPENPSSIDETEYLQLSHYKLIDEVWHYCSVDWGSRCMKCAAQYLQRGYSDISQTFA